MKPKPAIKCRTGGVLWSVGDYQEICPRILCRANSICGADGNNLCVNKIELTPRSKKPKVGRDYKMNIRSKKNEIK
jgi:hypothetical protein